MEDINMNYIDDANSESMEEFTSYYKEEIFKQVALIREELAKIDEDPEQISVFKNITECGRIINDLAMVYGYEGVEVIGSRIVEAVNNYSDQINFGDLIIKLENATKAVEDAMILVDERKERKVIRDLSQYAKIQHQDPEIDPKKTDEIEEPEENIFDIREDEKLISLLSDTDGQAVEIKQKNEEEDEADIDADFILGEHYANINFDIPKPLNDDENTIDEIIDNDVLKIDFKNKETETESEGGGEGLFKKIGGLFGKKHKNRISYQE